MKNRRKTGENKGIELENQSSTSSPSSSSSAPRDLSYLFLSFCFCCFGIFLWRTRVASNEDTRQSDVNVNEISKLYYSIGPDLDDSSCRKWSNEISDVSSSSTSIHHDDRWREYKYHNIMERRLQQTISPSSLISEYTRYPFRFPRDMSLFTEEY